MYILKEVCYLLTSIAAIQFFFRSVITSREHSKQSIFQEHYFTTFVANILFNKRSVVDSRKLEGYVYLRRVIVAHSTEIVALMFV